jgi:hypothetical protein
MALETKYTALVEKLRNQAHERPGRMNPLDVLLAADAIEETVNELIALQASLELMVDDADDMNRIGAGINTSRIRKLLQLKETE